MQKKMEEELNYLSEKLQEIESKISRDIDYGYTGEKLDTQLYEQGILENIINIITINEINNS